MEKGPRSAGKKADLPNAAMSDGEVKRIFIGGMGAGVTAPDMDKAFSSLGKVHAVEFVRTNGRNFAYMDFEPSSAKSIVNLFSTYNGCTWKGGKLKLEMAKEHYLTRLKREWAGDAMLASAPHATEENLEIVRSQFSNPENSENSQIRIYFPKLRKVMPLPFKGTGKHKYSFQRTEVPPLPIHFCDCEEHSNVLETTCHKYLSPLCAVVHENEHNVYSNVINKLIGGSNYDTTSGREINAASGLNTSPCIEDIHSKEAEVSDTDDDNLVMNIGARAEDDIFMQLKGAMTTITGQESGFGNPQLVQNKANSGKRKKSQLTNASSIKANKRTRSVSAELSEHESAPAITQNATSAFSAGETLPSLPHMTSESSDLAPKLLAETYIVEIQDKPNPDNARPAERQSWLQKSSWKDLVAGKGSSSFCISTLLSGVAASSIEIPAKPNASDASAHPAGKKPDTFSGKSKLMPPNAPVTSGMNSKELPSKDTLFNVQEKPDESKASVVQEQRRERAGPSFGTVCPFMRSAESEQQWAKAKAALSGFIRRKSNEGNASKFTRGKR